jgi:glycosyltransferase involved in cell wall biosynthesis
LNHYSSVPSKDGGFGRHLGLARELRDGGWDPTLFIASTLHPSGRQAEPGLWLSRSTIELGVPCVWIRTPAYGSSQVLRLMNIVAFTVGVLLPGATRHLNPPDLVWGSTVHPLAAWAGARLARRFHVPFVYEIRDVWPDTLVDLRAIKPGGMIERLLNRLSDSLLQQSSLVLSPLGSIDKYVRHRGFIDKPCLWIPNGVDESFDHMGIPQRTHDSDFTFMYFGSHGRANDLVTLISAFDSTCEQHADANLHLRLIGDGQEKPRLKTMAARLKHAARISFEDRVPRSQVLTLAQEADCLVSALADLPVYRYGTSLNKHSDYLLAGRPVIACLSAQGGLITDAGAGFAVPPENPAALAEAMGRIMSLTSDERAEFGARGRRYALANLTYQSLGHRLSEALADLIRPAPQL